MSTPPSGPAARREPSIPTDPIRGTDEEVLAGGSSGAESTAARLLR